MTISDDTARQLLHTAETAITKLFSDNKADNTGRPTIDIDYEGVFVTLHVGDNLRGCIGYVAHLKPLGDAVYELAQKSATTDRRFQPLAKAELDTVDIEITVLGPMETIDSAEELEIGTHGVYIERGHRRGILLPQVASERGWTAEQFMEAVCEKAMLPQDTWRLPGTVLKRFSAEILPRKQHNEGGHKN